MQYKKLERYILIFLILISPMLLGLLLPSVPKHSVLPGLSEDDHKIYFVDTTIGTRAKDYTTTGVGTFGYLNLTNETSGYQIDGVRILTNKGTNNILIGAGAGSNNVGTSNVFLGYQAGPSNTSGAYNVAIGSQSLYVNSYGSRNTAVGYRAGVANQTGSGNVYIGYHAGKLASDDSNTLYINNEYSDDPLIYGDFDANTITIGGSLTATSLTATGDTITSTLAVDTNSLVANISGYTDKVGVGTAVPAYKFSIGSTNGSDQIGIYHDNTDAYVKWNDGVLFLQTDEGDNTNTSIRIKGKGTGYGEIRVYQDPTNYYYFRASENRATITAIGASMVAFSIQENAIVPVEMFRYASEGETQELQIYGYRTGDAARRSLQIGVGVDTNDTASFDGLTNYWFDGEVDAQTKFKVAGTQVVGAQQDHIVDADAAVASAAGDPPTQAEFNALVTAYNDLATKFNTLLAELDADAGHGLLAGVP